MNLRRPLKIILVLIVVICNVGCDQVSKEIVRDNINLNDRISVIDDNIVLTHVENKGAALSLGADLNNFNRSLFLKVFPITILLILLLYTLLSKSITKYALIAFSFIIGGGIGNIYDRILYDSVTDFMFLSIWEFKTGIFNMADVSIVVGVGVIIVEYIRNLKSYKPNLA